MDTMSFFHTYPNDVSLDEPHYMVSIEYYDYDHDINHDFIQCESMFDVVCLCDKLDDDNYITSINYEPIGSQLNMDQSPWLWTDW